MRTVVPLPTPAATPPLTALATPTPTPVPTTTPLTIAVETPDPTPPAIETLTGYVWPLARPRLTQGFGPAAGASRIVNGKGFHDGADLATFCGDRIKAAHSGTVLAAGRRYDEHIGWVGSLGPYLRRLDKHHLWHQLPIVVVIDDGNGYRSMYAHFGRVVVKAGQDVKAGQLLGFEGATGRASGCHLHYGLYSPFETRTIAIRSDVVRRMKLPRAEIARVDPLLVLPPKPGVNAPKSPKASPSPTPSP